MSQNQEFPLPSQMPADVTTCSNCHSPMPGGLRFCRNCGFRLNYGDNGPHTNQGLTAQPVSSSLAGKRKKRRMSGMAWIFVGLLAFFVVAAGFTAIVTPFRHASQIQFTVPVTKSYLGVDGFDTADNGVTFDSTDCPGGPADKAGLVGGDIITSFDGQQINDEDQISELLQKTPIGKTVDVTYVRDGQTKTTKLTTISKEEFDRLNAVINKRPEGRGHFGYEEGDSERVEIPNSKLFGVKLDRILPSRPADLAGIKNGDIVIEFDGVPIRTREEFRARVRRAMPYSTVKVVVMRGNEKLEIPVKMGKQ